MDKDILGAIIGGAATGVVIFVAIVWLLLDKDILGAILK